MVDRYFDFKHRGPWPGEQIGNGEWTFSGIAHNNFWANMAGCDKHFDTTLWRLFHGLMASHAPRTEAYIGLHVRHGDKVDEGRVLALSELMQEVDDATSSLNLSHVFLATDDA